MYKKLYYTATGCSNILNISVSTSHEMSTATAIITTESTTLTLGDTVTIDIGYSDNHKEIFTGHVKQIERNVPEDVYSIMLNDVMIRAIDYFIASSSPANPLTFQNIAAESLVQQLMALPGLTNYTYDATYFTFGITSSFEINLVSVFDFCRMVADVLTWNLWADSAGQIHFENRKPYVMTGTSGQPGDVADTPTGYTVTDSTALEIGYDSSDKDLRNRIVVYGGSDMSAEASRSVSSLPAGFYKSAVLMLGMVDEQGLLQTTADYNLDLLCRITETVNVVVLGDPDLSSRTVISCNTTKPALTGDWYVYGCEHRIGQTGYVCNLDLRRMTAE